MRVIIFYHCARQCNGVSGLAECARWWMAADAPASVSTKALAATCSLKLHAETRTRCGTGAGCWWSTQHTCRGEPLSIEAEGDSHIRRKALLYHSKQTMSNYY